MDSSQWVSIHIRDRLEKGEISIKDSFLYEYASHPLPPPPSTQPYLPLTLTKPEEPSTLPPTKPSPSQKPTLTPSPSPPTASARSAPVAAAAARAGWTCFMARTRYVNCTGTIVTRSRSIGLRCRGLIASIGLSVVDGVRGRGRWGMFLLILRRRRLLLRKPRPRLRLLLKRRLFENEVSRSKGLDRYYVMEFGSMIFVYSILGF